MKYDVHLYEVVRVKVINIEADSQEQAIKKAQTFAGPLLNEFLSLSGSDEAIEPAIAHAEWCDDEPTVYFLVDEQGDAEYEQTRFYDKDINLLTADDLGRPLDIRR